MDTSSTIVQSAEQGEQARRLSLETQSEPSALAPDIPGYVLHTLLGRGSFGEVWASTQSGSGQQVAVKIFTQPGGLDWRYLQHEIRRLRQVAEHPHVVTLLHADFNHEPPYFCMGLYQESLSSWRQKAEHIEVEKVVGWFREIALALQFTHEKGLLHCDLKPANVLLDEEGRVRVADFGQAVERGLPGRAVGSLGFMAPEQASMSENSPDIRWDLYGLGSTIYFLLTGKAPRLSDAGRETMGSISDPSARLDRYREVLSGSHLIPLQELCSSVDNDLAELVHSCLSLDPEKRPQTAGEVLEDLNRRESLRPLLCRRPWSKSYRLKRYIHRNKVALMGIALILAILGYAISETYQRSQEQRLALAAQQFDTGWNLAKEGQAAEAAYWWGKSIQTNPESEIARAALDSVSVDLEKELVHGPDPLNTVVFHPNGEWLASADSEGTVQLWKDGRSELRLTGKRKVTSNSHSVPTPQLAFSSDGKHLITSGGLYEVGKELPAKVFSGESFFDSDGHGALVLEPEGAILFNALTFAEVKIELRDRDEVSKVAVSPSGRDFAVLYEDGQISLYRDGKRRSEPFSGQITALGFSHDGHWLVTCSRDRSAKLWDVESGKLRHTLEHKWPVMSARFSKDGLRLATTSFNGEILSWEVESGKLMLESPMKHSWLAYGTSPSADGKLMASFGIDGKSRVWNVLTGEPHTPWLQHGSAVRGVAMRPDGKQLVTAGQNGKLRLWKVQPARSMLRSYQYDSREEILSVCYDPQAEFVGTSWRRFPEGGGARLWRLDNGEQIELLSHEKLRVREIEFSPDGEKIATAGEDGMVRLFNRDGKQEESWKHEKEIRSVSFSADGKNVLSAGGDEIIQLWGEENAIFPVGARVTSARLNPDSTQLASSDRLGRVIIWDVKNQTKVKEFRHPVSVLRLAWSPKGDRLVYCGLDGQAVLVELTSESKTILEHDLIVTSASFNSDDTKIATTSLDGSVKIWDAHSGQPITSPIGHDGPALRSTFSPDGELLLSMSMDGNAQLWDVETGLAFGLPIHHERACYDGVFSPNGQFVLTGSQDGVVKVTPVPLWNNPSPPKLEELAKRMGLKVEDMEQLWTP